MRKTWKPATAFMTGVFLGIVTSAATAQDLSSSISCLKGKVPAGDYSEMSQNLRENLWDQKAGVTLTADTDGLTLKVTDPNGNSVCEDDANNKASCRFRLSNSQYDSFLIRVENLDSPSPVAYKVCAF